MLPDGCGFAEPVTTGFNSVFKSATGKPGAGMGGGGGGAGGGIEDDFLVSKIWADIGGGGASVSYKNKKK